MSGPKSILFYLPHLGGGGAEKHTARLVAGLVDRGFLVNVAVNGNRGGYEEMLPKEVRIFRLRSKDYSSSTLSLLMALPKLARLIARETPTVLCPVMVSSGAVASIACRFSRHKPITVLLIQNTLFPLVGRKYQRVARNVLSRAILRRADKIVALSKGVVLDILALDASLSSKTRHIANIGVPLPIEMLSRMSESRRIGGSKQSRLVEFIACGRLTEQKGFDVLLRALAEVSKNIDCVLHIVGDGPLMHELRLLADTLGLKERVIFHGHLTSPTEVFKKADIFVLSSRWEGFANVIVEAMSQGLPVIATDCTHGPGEILRGGEFGVLVTPNDVMALANGMISLAKDEEMRVDLSRKGRIRSQDYSVETICDSWEKLLEET
jgi:glycosyltransferase involved in cell wall biosynthesis